ncbi:DUF3667 domain-containing protein [Phenylobacterium aquaticum]|uniref:DUF3667 domain-containing protein n=1 Tax=Phenylobacterium aquaticum TaxID=1763816 RepID=UPI0026ED76EB|nr:DUF3667 domain-containing protein [Phenylobacterium aquaticum]
MTGADLEVAAADSVRELFRRKPEPFTRQGEPCANCGTPLEGHYCHECGQNSDTHHRSLLHLIVEAIEGMFHLDGRLARTVPLLFFKPGVLAKDYMEGRIARHVPPFRTFLVALLLFIFAAEHAIHGVQHQAQEVARKRAEALQTPQGRTTEAARMRTMAATVRDAALKALDETRDENLKDGDMPRAKVLAKHDSSQKFIQAQYARELAKANLLEHDPEAGKRALEASEHVGKSAADQLRGMTDDAESAAVAGEKSTLGVEIAGVKLKPSPPRKGEGPHDKEWFKAQLAKALDNPEYYFMVMFGWAHRLAVLLLPIIGLSLALVYVNKRQYFIYDHLLVATNLLSFAFLTNALGFILPAWAAGFWFLILIFWTPINLFQTLRGGYGSSIPGALFKTLFVWFSSVFAFSLLLSGLMFFSLAQL